jgi:hypothetical protein
MLMAYNRSICDNCRDNEVCNKLDCNSQDTVINRISKIREDNNKCWMDILRLAFKHAPKESKQIFKFITENDAKINELSKRLCE